MLNQLHPKYYSRSPFSELWFSLLLPFGDSDLPQVPRPGSVADEEKASPVRRPLKKLILCRMPGNNDRITAIGGYQEDIAMGCVALTHGTESNKIAHRASNWQTEALSVGNGCSLQHPHIRLLSRFLLIRQPCLDCELRGQTSRQETSLRGICNLFSHYKLCECLIHPGF